MVTNIYAKGGVAATIEQDDTSRLMPYSTKELMDNNTLHVVATSDAVLTSAESKHDEPTDINMPTSTVHTAENSVTIVSTDGNFECSLTTSGTASLCALHLFRCCSHLLYQGHQHQLTCCSRMLTTTTINWMVWRQHLLTSWQAIMMLWVWLASSPPRHTQCCSPQHHRELEHQHQLLANARDALSTCHQYGVVHVSPPDVR